MSMKKIYEVTMFGTSREIEAMGTDAAIFREMLGRGLIRINRINSSGGYEVMLDPNKLLGPKASFDVVAKFKGEAPAGFVRSQRAATNTEVKE